MALDLTDRQKEVYTLVLRGLTYREIAQELELSVRTAEFHAERIAHRLPGSGPPIRKILTYAVQHPAENGHL